jgi:hypothetical protein
MTASLQRIYKDMAPEQLAVVAVNFDLNGDHESSHALLAYVPKKQYLATDARYSDYAQYLEGMVVALGNDFWKATALHLYSLLELSRWSRTDGKHEESMTAEAFEKQQDRLDTLLERAIAWRQNAEMLSGVCTTICKETGISEDALRDQIGMDAADASFNPENLPENVRKQMDAILENFRNGKKRVTA